MYDNVINFFPQYDKCSILNTSIKTICQQTTHLCTLWNKNVFEQKYVISIQLSDNQFNYHSSPHFQLGGSSPQTVLSQGAIEAPTLTQVFFSKELNKNLLIKWALVVHKPFKSHPK